MTSNDAFRENLTFAYDYFKWENLIIFGHIQENQFQFSSSSYLKFISRETDLREFLQNYLSWVKL